MEELCNKHLYAHQYSLSLTFYYIYYTSVDKPIPLSIIHKANLFFGVFSSTVNSTFSKYTPKYFIFGG